MDGEAWRVTVRGATKSRTRLSDFTFNLRTVSDTYFGSAVTFCFQS